MSKNYYIGLDIGTESCGWAVTDENYNLINMKGKDLWGARIFGEAETSSKRREVRTGRRRLARKKMQLNWLKDIFRDEIEALDPNFFVRLKYSALFQDDKDKSSNYKLKTKDSLFNGELQNGEEYNDKKYFEDYKTIYHLRKELLTNPAKDVRLLFLALYNIVKHRGHFLQENDSGENASINLTEKFNELINVINDTVEENKEENKSELNSKEFEYKKIAEKLEKEKENFEAEIKNLLKNCKSKKDLKDGLTKFFNLKNMNFVECIYNGKLKLSKFFNLELENGLEKEEDEYDFNDEKFLDVKIGEISELVSENQYNIVIKLKELFDCIQLIAILGDSNYICEAKVKDFEKHRIQLNGDKNTGEEGFKDFIKKYYPKDYNLIFRESGSKENPKKKNDDQKNEDNEGKEDSKSKAVTNYSLYVNSGLVDGYKVIVNLTSNEDRTQKEFYSFIGSILKKEPQKNENFNEEEFNNKKDKYKELIGGKEFLPLLRTKSNVNFPNWLYIKEAKKILEINKEKFAFLNNKDDSNLTNAEKIIEIIKFRVPYFVGPIGEKESQDKNCKHWAVVNSDLKLLELYPWTIGNIVDFDESESKFIETKINKCTYLAKDAYVEPKNSMLYQEFAVLNELNNIKINGDKKLFTPKLKQEFFEEYFENNKTVTKKNLEDFLKRKGIVEKNEKPEIGGVDKNNFKNNCSTLINFKKIFNDNAFINKNRETLDEIVKLRTIINDKNRFIERVKKNYPDFIDDDKLKKIAGLTFSGWGSLSREFLTMPFTVESKKGKRTTSVMEELYGENSDLDINQNLMEIYNQVHEKNNLSDIIYDNSIDENSLKTISYDKVRESYCSPAVKRSVWQSLKTVKEIEQIMGSKPKKIIVEVTRGDGEKEEPKKRKDQLKNLYKSEDFKKAVKSMCEQFKEVQEELNNEKDGNFSKEKFYLYYKQLGKSAYSGDKLDLVNLKDYDVDHIIPRSLVKDDSLENKVLVKRNENQEKGDEYPLNLMTINKMKGFWNILKDAKLMSTEKYDRLTRIKPFSLDEEADFIARQLVETGQSAKGVIDILRTVYGKDLCVFSKARTVSNFRKRFSIVKTRDVNDFHHAKDAYLNIVVGNVFNQCFTEDPRNYYKDKKVTRDDENINFLENNNDKEDETTKFDVLNLFCHDLKHIRNKNQIIWKGWEDIKKVKETCEKNTCLVSQMAYKDGNKLFYNATRYKSKKNNKKSKAKIKLKGSDDNLLHNIERYGGYDSLENAYFMVIQSKDKKDIKKCIYGLPVNIYVKYKNDKDKDEKFLQYIAQQEKLEDPKIIVPILRFKSVLQIGSGRYLLGGKTGQQVELHNFNEWYVSSNDAEYIEYIKKVAKNPDNFKSEEEKDEICLKEIKNKKGEVKRRIYVTKERNLELYNVFIKQLKKPLYKGTNIEKVAETLNSSKDKFENLSIVNQCVQLEEVLKMLSRGSATCDLKLIGGVEQAGKVTINKNITDKDIYLINQSVTGFYERKIKL